MELHNFVAFWHRKIKHSSCRLMWSSRMCVCVHPLSCMWISAFEILCHFCQSLWLVVEINFATAGHSWERPSYLLQSVSVMSVFFTQEQKVVTSWKLLVTCVTGCALLLAVPDSVLTIMDAHCCLLNQLICSAYAELLILHYCKCCNTYHNTFSVLQWLLQYFCS